MNVTSRIKLALAHRREFLRVLGELETYRDNELHDIRLDRADFAQVARDAADAHVASLAAPQRSLRVPGWSGAGAY